MTPLAWIALAGAVLGLLGLVAAALLLGLYLGERGRRWDAQRIARVADYGRADVEETEDPEVVAAERVRERDVEMLAAGIAEKEGVPLHIAREAAEGMVQQLDTWAPDRAL